MSKKLLVVDDEQGICEFVANVAMDLGFEVSMANSCRDFEAMYRDLQPSLIVMDLSLPDGDGVEMLRFLNAEECRAQILLMSGFDKRILSTAEQLGSDQGLLMIGTLNKPLMIEELESLLGSADGGTASIGLDELNAAFKEDQFFMMFQPKAQIDEDGVWTIKSSEALIRWQHPTRGVLNPGEFIPLVEKAEMLFPMTQIAFRKSLEQIAEWKRSGLEMNVSVNVPPQLLSDLTLPDEFAQTAQDLDVDASSVTLEITETGVMEDVGAAMDILTRFRLKGFKLSLDDYGTGFSSLKQLYRMPFSELKIDQSFVQDVARSREAAVIVRTSAEMASNLDLEVCMEGVEDQAQLDFVMSVPCHSIQGYFISRPITGDSMLAFAQSWSGILGASADVLEASDD